MRKPAESSMNTTMQPAGKRNVMPPTVNKAPSSTKAAPMKSVSSTPRPSVPRGSVPAGKSAAGSKLFRNQKF